MRLIIDTNIFHVVFDPTHSDFENYKPVAKCLLKCKGVLVFGGTTFSKEIVGMEKYRKSLKLLRDRRKLEILDIQEVDDKIKELKVIEPSKNFDDPHLIACCIIGKCKLVCTDDSRADTYIKDSRFYPKSTMRPKIYRKATHNHLLRACF